MREPRLPPALRTRSESNSADSATIRVRDSAISLDRLTEHVVAAVEAAQAVGTPFLHLRLEGIFPGDVYAAMLQAMPAAAEYRAMSGRTRRDYAAGAAPSRVKIDLFPEYVRHLPADQYAIWSAVGQALCSAPVKAAFVRRLAPDLERRFGAAYAEVGLYPIPVLTRDLPGYRIPPHPDTHWKAITVQLYLPRDNAINHVGTVFHERLPEGLRRNIQMSFSPNTGYAFAVGGETWHSVDPVGPEVDSRDSILLTYFTDSGLFRILRNRGKRLGNFLQNELRNLARQ
jgi:hypothetical protein